MPVDEILRSIHHERNEVTAEIKELNSMIAQLELRGTSSSSLEALRSDRRTKEENLARLNRIMVAATDVTAEPGKPVAFTQRAVATTRSELFEVQQRVKELRAAGKLKGKKSRLPLDDCYDLLRTSPRLREVVGEQFWAQVDKSETHGECWPA